jgi:site-specific DNA-methyltransferase (adenine-specific)
MAIDLSIARRPRALAPTHTSVFPESTGWDAPWWKLLAKRWGSVMHAMCSYMGMFPASLPRYFIEQFTEPGDIVVDPFSGRGTAPLEACIAGRVGIGVDLNPLAALLTRAKVDPPTLDETLARIDDLERTYSRALVTDRAPPEIEILFDGRRTLPQLLHMREKLDPDDRTDRFLLASLTGILHGNHSTKDPRTSRCLSISMPNTFSMSPGYLRRFIRQNKLKKYPFDAFERLRTRMHHLYEDGMPAMRGQGIQGDALALTKHIAPGSAKLVITSPPYLNVVRYGKFNWIRLWLLKESVERVDRSLRGHTDLSLQVEKTDLQLGLSDRLNFRRYCEFLRLSLTECAHVLRDDGLCVVTIGDVETNQHDRRLALEAWQAIANDVPLTLSTVIDDHIDTTIKVSRIWGETKGRATKVDRVLVLQKKHAPKPRHDPNELVARLAATPTRMQDEPANEVGIAASAR